MGQHDVERRAAARAAAFQQRRLKPAAMLVGAFEIHHRVVAAVELALDAGEARKVPRVFEHESVRRAGIEPDVENVVDLLPAVVAELAEEALARARRIPGVGAFRSNASTMRTLTSGSSRISTEPSGFSLMKTVIGTPQARWREITQSGRLSIMPLMRFSPCAGTQRVASIASSARWRSVSPCSVDVLIHRNEPLRRVAKDHRLLRAPRMRILVLEPAARDQHAGVDQRLDHRLVGVALLAFVGEHALAGEARRLIGEAAVGIDGVGNMRVDAARGELRRIRHPDIKVLAAMSGRGVHEAGAGIVGDMIAGKKRHLEIVVSCKPLSGCAQSTSD